MQTPQRDPDAVRRIEQKYRRLERQKRRRKLREDLPFYLIVPVLVLILAGLLLYGSRKRAAVPEIAADTLRVYLLDVGQGDAILIESQGHAALIDAGEADQGGRVTEMLHSLGIRQLDFIVNSHPHSDHCGGLSAVLSQIPAGKLWLPAVPEALMPTGYSFASMLTAAEKQGIPVGTPENRTRVTLGGAELEFLCTDNSAFTNLNDCSLVCLLTCGAQRFLFTGDLEAEGEQAMLAAGLIPQVTVLKAGHHGSSRSTSEALLRAAQPQYAGISVGALNDYGHPSAQTLRRLRENGCEIFRTDLDGTVCFSTDGSTLRVVTGLSF